MIQSPALLALLLSIAAAQEPAVADNGIHGRELWRSDGTPEGTLMVADIEPGGTGSDPAGLKVVGTRLYFHALRKDIGRELHVLELPTDP